MVCCLGTQRSENCFVQHLPMVTPALKSNAVQVDHELLDARAWKTGALTVAADGAALGVALAFPTYLPVVLPSIVVVAVVAFIVVQADHYLSNRAADSNAVAHFQNQIVPVAAATQQIVLSRRAFNWILKSGVDLNKKDESGRRLGDVLVPRYREIYNKELLMLSDIIQKGMRVRKEDIQKAAQFRSPAVLELYFKQGMVKPNDFSANEQVDLWAKAGSIATLRALHRIGFDVNVTNSAGYSPLHAVMEGTNWVYTSRDLDKEAHIRILLSLGADPELGPRGWNMRRTLPEYLGSNPEIQDVLRDAREKKN